MAFWHLAAGSIQNKLILKQNKRFIRWINSDNTRLKQMWVIKIGSIPSKLDGNRFGDHDHHHTHAQLLRLSWTYSLTFLFERATNVLYRLCRRSVLPVTVNPTFKNVVSTIYVCCRSFQFDIILWRFEWLTLGKSNSRDKVWFNKG